MSERSYYEKMLGVSLPEGLTLGPDHASVLSDEPDVHADPHEHPDCSLCEIIIRARGDVRENGGD